MRQLNIEVETPSNFCDIDFAKMAAHFGDPVDIITDLEGTAITWGYRAGHAVVGQDVTQAITDAVLDETVVGAHSMTNRAGSGGRALTVLFTRSVQSVNPDLPSLGEYPRSRSERKPSGVMGTRLIERLRQSDEIWATKKRRAATSLVIAFVGDKLSDMLEAEALQERLNIPVIGFMVKRYGESDHPLDTLFGKRRKATAEREALKEIARNRFLK